jgi:hypothetical protein
MRIAVIALVVVALVPLFACKDKTPAQKQPPAARESATKAQPPSLEPPTVSGPGLVPAVGLGPKLTVSKTEIKIDEQSIATFGEDGLIDKSRLDAIARVLEQKANSDAPIALALDRTVPYRRLAHLLDALDRAGFRQFGLLTGNGGQMIPIETPDPAAANAPGLRLVISVDRTQLRLWSVSGQEGTRRQPKLSMAAGDHASYAPLTRALAEIVQRRWPDGERSAADRSVLVQVDPNQSAQSLLGLLAAIRADGSLELFPNIMLSGGL